MSRAQLIIHLQDESNRKTARLARQTRSERHFNERVCVCAYVRDRSASALHCSWPAAHVFQFSYTHTHAHTHRETHRQRGTQSRSSWSFVCALQLCAMLKKNRKLGCPADRQSDQPTDLNRETHTHRGRYIDLCVCCLRLFAWPYKMAAYWKHFDACDLCNGKISAH